METYYKLKKNVPSLRNLSSGGRGWTKDLSKSSARALSTIFVFKGDLSLFLQKGS